MDFVSTDGFPSGRLQWDDKRQEVQKIVVKRTRKGSSVQLMSMISAATVALVMAVYAGQYFFSVLTLTAYI